MNPLAAIAAAFIALQTDLRTRFNAALGKLPPLGVASLAAVGITQLARPLGFASLLAVSLDDAGSTEFAARLAVLQESAPVAVPIAAAGVPAPKPATIATVLPAAPAESTPARKSVFI